MESYAKLTRQLGRGTKHGSTPSFPRKRERKASVAPAALDSRLRGSDDKKIPLQILVDSQIASRDAVLIAVVSGS